MWTLFTSVLLCVFALAHLARADAERGAEPDSQVRVELISSTVTYVPGKTTTVAVRFAIRPEWHVYWINPGESGLAPQIKWTLPQGVQVAPLRFPTPKRIDGPGGLTTYGYENELVLLTDLTVPTDFTGQLELKADVSWLVCKDVCLAERSSASFTLAPGDGGANRIDDFLKWEAKQPLRADDASTKVIKSAEITVAKRLPKTLPTARLTVLNKESAELRIEGIDGRRVRDFFPPASENLVFATGSVVTHSGKQVYTVGVSILPHESSDGLMQSPAIVVFENEDQQVIAAEIVCTVQTDRP